jgi:hypothetical protein
VRGQPLRHQTGTPAAACDSGSQLALLGCCRPYMAARQLHRRVAALALLSAAALGAAGRFDQYRTCEGCIAAGLGWSRTKQKCGGYQNKQCTGVALPGEAIDADAEAAALEAARVEIDAANMAEAKRLALTSPHAALSAAVKVQQCGKVRTLCPELGGLLARR